MLVQCVWWFVTKSPQLTRLHIIIFISWFRYPLALWGERFRILRVLRYGVWGRGLYAGIMQRGQSQNASASVLSQVVGLPPHLNESFVLFSTLEYNSVLCTPYKNEGKQARVAIWNIPQTVYSGLGASVREWYTEKWTWDGRIQFSLETKIEIRAQLSFLEMVLVLVV